MTYCHVSRTFAAMMRLEKKIRHLEVEVLNLSQENIKLKTHLIEVERLNRERQQTIWGLQSRMDKPLFKH